MVDLTGNVEDPGSIFPTTAVGAGGKEGTMVPMRSFSSFMTPGAASPMAGAGKLAMISPFQMMQGSTPVATQGTMDSLFKQVGSIQSTLGDIGDQLNTPNLKLPASTKYLTKSKLTDAVSSMRTANAKLGADVPAEPDPSKFTGPLGRFFSYLQDGQAQMQAAQQQLQNLKDKGQQINPGDFLLVQVKMNTAQQLLEFTSVLLSNAVSGLKSMMQIQI